MMLYAGLLAAWVATVGSLYMSEVLGWIPCTWCWYQRIAMYPLSVLLAVGIAQRDVRVALYALLLAVPGALASIWHILIQKVDIVTLLYPCRSSSPCSSDSLWTLGWFPYWVTVPMLALTAFTIIIATCIAALVVQRKARTSAQADEGLPPVAFVGAIVAPVVLLFGLSAYLNAPKTGPATFNPGTPTNPGAQTFTQSCQGCHAVQGQDHVNIRASWVLGKSNEQIADFIKKGRTVTDAENFSKLAMPPYGGQPFLTDAQLLDLARHVSGK